VEAFFARLRDVGLMVRERRSELDGALTGYAVALAGQGGERGVPVFYSGGKLAADLTLPKLAARWAPARQTADAGVPGPGRETGRAGTRPAAGDGGLSAEQRAAVWAQAIDAAGRASAASAPT